MGRRPPGMDGKRFLLVSAAAALTADLGRQVRREGHGHGHGHDVRYHLGPAA